MAFMILRRLLIWLAPFAFRYARKRMRGRRGIRRR